MCSVILDGQIVYSCMTPCWRGEGKKITTVEGLEAGGKLHPLQESFVKNFASQCGYCTPAMLLSAKAIMDFDLNPTEEELLDALCGVLCRCTGYVSYLRAIKEALLQARNLKSGSQ